MLLKPEGSEDVTAWLATADVVLVELDVVVGRVVCCGGLNIK